MLVVDKLINMEDDVLFDKILHRASKDPTIENQTINAHRVIRNMKKRFSYEKANSFIIIDNNGRNVHLVTPRNPTLPGLNGAVWNEIKKLGVRAFYQFGETDEYDKKSVIVKFIGEYYNVITDLNESNVLPNKSYNEEEYQKRVCCDTRKRLYDNDGKLDVFEIKKMTEIIGMYFWRAGYSIIEIIKRKLLYHYPMKSQVEESLRRITDDEHFDSVCKLKKIYYNVIKEKNPC